MKAYKIVIVFNFKFMSWATTSNKYCVQYCEGTKIKAPKGTKLFVFSELSDLLKWRFNDYLKGISFNNDCSDIHVFEVDIPRDSFPQETMVKYKEMVFNEELLDKFWSGNLDKEYHDLTPEGTLGAKRLKILRKLTRDEIYTELMKVKKAVYDNQRTN